MVVPVRAFSGRMEPDAEPFSAAGSAGSVPEAVDSPDVEAPGLLSTVPISVEPILQLAVVAVLVVPVSWVSEGGLVHTCCTAPMFAEAVVAVLVVPVTCVSHGGLEQILAAAVVAVLVVPVSWVSHGGLEQTKVTVAVPSPAPSPASAPVLEGWSEVGDARMETGRSGAGWASAPLGVVIKVTVVGCGADCIVARLVCAAGTVIAAGTWLDSVAMVERVVAGVARLALAPTTLEDAVLVTVPRVVIPVVPLTTSVVTVGFPADTVPGETSRTPPMGTVRRMVPGCPGAPFKTTCVTPCCPVPVSLGIAVMILPGVPVPGVTILVVIIVMGDLMPPLLVTPVAPC